MICIYLTSGMCVVLTAYKFELVKTRTYLSCRALFFLACSCLHWTEGLTQVVLIYMFVDTK